MTSDRLARAYLEKATVRIKALKFLHQEGGYSDVVREAQECVEILLKGVLRCLGIEAPKIHDVSRLLKQRMELLPQPLKDNIDEVSRISRNCGRTESWLSMVLRIGFPRRSTLTRIPWKPFGRPSGSSRSSPQSSGDAIRRVRNPVPMPHRTGRVDYMC